MSYRGEFLSKIDYAKLAAASLAFLILDQQDSVSVMSFAESLTPIIAPTASQAAFFDICEAMLPLETGGESDVGGALEAVAGLLTRRGVVVVISDFLSDVPATVKGLEHLRFEGHDVLAFQVLDHDEVDFPLAGLCAFEGLEGGRRVLTDAARVRSAYRGALNSFLEELRAGCVRAQVDHVLASTSESLDKVLSAYLLARSGGR
jgi:uncharacterized protein (DUF58 family)